MTKKSIRRTIIVGFLTILASHVQADETNLSAAHMQSYQAKYTYHLLDDNQQQTPAGIWIDRLTIKQDQVIRTVTRKPLGAEVDLIRTVAANRHTLAPVFSQQRFGPDLQGLLYTEFKSKQLQQFYLSDVDVSAKQSSTQLASVPVEVHLQGLLAASLPFTEATNITLDGYVMGTNPLNTQVTFENHGQEVIRIGDQQFTTWKIVEPKSHWTYWVQRDFPYLVQVTHPMADGSMSISLISDYSLSFQTIQQP
ncbi:hypothetical protein [Marinicella meishanensis]|uniref:hypothetical protein n=1 Tax=Marinicella meishanensis TaxID=2873263 RepID=UPI001CBC4B1F|nr:hypothetical protein [Marinicella sp. NBU2979]